MIPIERCTASSERNNIDFLGDNTRLQTSYGKRFASRGSIYNKVGALCAPREQVPVISLNPSKNYSFPVTQCAAYKLVMNNCNRS